MIYGTHYQTLITGKDLVNGGATALKTLRYGEVAIVDETPGHVGQVISDWDKVLFFSLYEATVNEKGKRVLMKHSGARPISTERIRIKTIARARPAVPQYWQIVLQETFAPCCKDYTVKFTLQSEQIQKSQFPNYYVQEISVKKECCEEACGGEPNPFTNDELAFMLWYEVMLNKEDYLKASIMIADGGDVYNTPITAHDEDGNAYFTYDGTDYRNISFREGKVYYDGGEAESITEFLSTVLGINDPANYPTSFAIVFEIDSELELRSGNINLKYDYLRNVRADMTLEGGFKCAEGIETANNDVVVSGSEVIYNEGGNPVPQFSYPVGSGYDVRQMEQYDSRRTVNSPYPFSNFAHSESGIQFLSDERTWYDMLTIEYQQHSDALGGEFPHPHGTTICFEQVPNCEEAYIYEILREKPTKGNYYVVLPNLLDEGATIAADQFVNSKGENPKPDENDDIVLTSEDVSNIIATNFCNEEGDTMTNWSLFIEKTLGVSLKKE